MQLRIQTKHFKTTWAQLREIDVEPSASNLTHESDIHTVVWFEGFIVFVAVQQGEGDIGAL